MNRRLTVILAAVLVLVTAAWWFILWSPRNDEIAAANERREIAEEASSQLQVRLSRLRGLEADEPRRRAQLESIRTAVPDTPNPAELILALNDVAIRSGVEFASVTISQPTGAGFQPMNLSLNISGGYFQVLDYINRVNDMPRLIVIDSVPFSPGDGGSTFSMTLPARAFTRNVSPGAPTAQAPAPPAGAGTPPTTVAGAPATTAPPTPATVAP